MADSLDQFLSQSRPASLDSVLSQGSGRSSSPSLDDALRGGGSSSSGLPVTGNSSAAPTSDADAPWYKKAWDWANTPLIESFGIPSEREGAGGFERAGEHILSGFTSPLSILLTAATFGTGGLIESAGANLLKEAGLSATEIAEATKASEVAANAAKELPSAEPAIREALTANGHDLGLVDRARKALGPVNLEDKFAEPQVQSALSKAGFSESELENLGKASETIKDAKANFTPIEDAVRNAGLDVDKWKTAQSLLNDNGLSEADLNGGNALERGAFQIVRRVVPDMSIAGAARVAKTANTVLNAGFTLQQFQQAAALSPRFLDALKEGDYDKAMEYGTEALVGGALGAAGAGHAVHAAGELFSPLIEPKFRPNDEWLSYNAAHSEREALQTVGEQEAINLDKQVREALGHKEPKGVNGDSAAVKAQKDLDLATVFHQVVTGGDANKAAAWYNALAEAAGKDDRLPVNGQTELPPDLESKIADSEFAKRPEEYQNLVLKSLKNIAEDNLTDQQKSAADLVRDEQSKNFELGSANDLLTKQIDNYMTRVYKDENPEGKVVLSNAKGGRFATNVSMARQRVYDSHLTALLKSPLEMDFDAAKNVAQGRGDIIKAAANKQFIDNLRDKFTRASDGRPAVVLSGSGQVISGPNGEDPATFIQPERVRKQQLSDNVVQDLTRSGDLQRFLEDGTLKEITPKIFPENLAGAIARFEDRMTGKKVTFDEEGNSENLKQLQFLKDIQSGKRPYSDLTEYNNNLKPMYAWDPQDYVSLDNAAMKGWNFITNDPSGNGVFVRGDIKVHPEFAENLKNRLGLEKSSLSQNPVGKALLGANTKLKQTLLSMSPFHMAQLALRGVMVGVNPFTLNTPDILDGVKVDPSDPNSPSIIRKAVEHGLTTGTDYKSLQEMSEGVASKGGILNKIPGVGKTIGNSMNWFEDFLFKRFMPALKANATEKIFRDYQRINPDWSVDRAAKATAMHVNDTFGGINWKAMGRSATTQDWGRLMLLAPDWLESEMRSMARLVNKDEGKLGKQQVAKMAMGLWGVARVLNYANTGNFHNEAPFGLAVKNKDGKEIVYSMRTLPTDILHAASDPVNFIKGRLSPDLGIATEAISGRDRYGRKLAPEDLWADIFRNMAPISLQAVGQAASGTGPDVGGAAQVWKGIGGSAQTYQTPAQQMAADLASSHSEDGLVDPAQQARHRTVMQMEDKVRNGEMTLPDLMRLTYQTDQLKESELKKIQTNLKHTQGMDSSMASLYTRASRLPAKEYLQLLDTMNTSEKAAMVPLTLQVQKKYLTKAKKDMTPKERQEDPTFQRLLNLIPQRPQPTAEAAPQSETHASVEYPYTATHGDTGHVIGSHDGVTWHDVETGAQVA